MTAPKDGEFVNAGSLEPTPGRLVKFLVYIDFLARQGAELERYVSHDRGT